VPWCLQALAGYGVVANSFEWPAAFRLSGKAAPALLQRHAAERVGAVAGAATNPH
jgi:hypothetical protein